MNPSSGTRYNSLIVTYLWHARRRGVNIHSAGLLNLALSVASGEWEGRRRAIPMSCSPLRSRDLIMSGRRAVSLCAELSRAQSGSRAIVSSLSSLQ